MLSVFVFLLNFFGGLGERVSTQNLLPQNYQSRNNEHLFNLESTNKRQDDGVSNQNHQIDGKHIALVVYKGRSFEVFKHRTLPRYYIKPVGFLIPSSLRVYEDILTGSHQLLFEIEMWNEEVRAVVASSLRNKGDVSSNLK